MKTLAEKYDVAHIPDNVVECPSPWRNTRPFRPKATGVQLPINHFPTRGKW